MRHNIPLESLLSAYCQGFFPMGDARHGKDIKWYSPDTRAVLPIERFRLSRSAKKLLRKRLFSVTFSRAFPEVIAACADRQETWINEEIIALYVALWERGYAHSVECWEQGLLAGGLYGVSIGGAFFGESMFSRVSGASKFALIHLMARLKAAGYLLCDVQFMNSYLAGFGAREIPRTDYLSLLEKAVHASPNPSMRFLSVSPESA